jgi:hypothetical protein
VKRLIVVLIAVSCCKAVGGTPADSTLSNGTCSLEIRTTPDSAWVLIDQEKAGLTPLTVDTLLPGRHVIRLLPHNVSSWFADPVDDTVELVPGDHRALLYTFDHLLHITSKPSGARVTIGDSVAGFTPLVLRIPSGYKGEALSIDKPGYQSTLIPLSGIASGVLSPHLQQTLLGPTYQSPLLDESSGGKRTDIKLYIAGSATVLAGVAAAYFKIKADNRNADYLSTGNSSLRDETHRLDVAAGVSLFTTEIAFAFLTYYLLSD